MPAAIDTQFRETVFFRFYFLRTFVGWSCGESELECSFRNTKGSQKQFQKYLVTYRKHVCMYVCLFGAYNYSGIVRQVSGFSNVSVSVSA